jgi:hypothetical protein
MFHLTIHDTQWKCRQSFRSSGEKGVYVIAQAEMLSLGKTVGKHKIVK